MDSSSVYTESISTPEVLRLCLRKRISPPQFLSILNDFIEKSKNNQSTLNKKLLCNDIIFPPFLNQTIDNLHIQYIAYLATSPDSPLELSFAINKISKIQKIHQKNEIYNIFISSFYLTLEKYISNWHSRSQDEIWSVVNALTVFISSISTKFLSIFDDKSSSQELKDESINLALSVANFLYALSKNHFFYDSTNSAFNDQRKILFCISLSKLSQFLKPEYPDYSHKLDILFPNHPPSQNISKSKSSLPFRGASFSANTKQNDIVTDSNYNNLNIIAFSKNATRVSRFLWLESHVIKLYNIQRGKITPAILQLLSGSSTEQQISYIIQSAFDCLSVSLSQVFQYDKTNNFWRTFIIARLPLIIQEILSTNKSSQSIDLEFAIALPIKALDSTTVSLIKTFSEKENNDEGLSGDNADAVIDEIFSSFGSTNMDLRHDFLKSCSNLNLIDFSSACQILSLGSVINLDSSNMNMDTELSANELISQIIHSNSNYEELIEKLIKLNFENINLQTIYTETIAGLFKHCIENSDMPKLKYLCIGLATNIDSLDIFVLLNDPREIWFNLIALLDNWQNEENDEDYGNFSEKYTQFGSILLFLLLLNFRYSLGFTKNNEENDSYPIPASESFVYKYIASGCDVISLSSCTPEQSNSLGSWILALFGSNGGITDPLLRRKPIQYLFMLIPSIFAQILSTANKNLLDIITINRGLEYFCQAFLLPTVVGGFKFLLSQMFDLTDCHNAMLIIQSLVLIPENLFTEQTRKLHQIVLSLFGKQIYDIIEEMTIKNIRYPGVNFQDIRNKISPYLSIQLFSPPEKHNSNIFNSVRSQIRLLKNWSYASQDKPFDEFMSESIVPSSSTHESNGSDKTQFKKNGVKNQSFDYSDLEKKINIFDKADKSLRRSFPLAFIGPNQNSNGIPPPLYNTRFIPYAVSVFGINQILKVIVDEYVIEKSGDKSDILLDIVCSLILYFLGSNNEENYLKLTKLFDNMIINHIENSNFNKLEALDQIQKSINYLMKVRNETLFI